VTIDFGKIAPYLKDPLVLIGFVLFLAFLFARQLLKSGIIPPVGAGPGAQILRLILHYGFILGVIIVLLGFGLKYRDITEHEQKTLLGLIVSELQYNLYVTSELEKNADTLSNAAETIAGVLRIERIRINYGLFPTENIDPNMDQHPDLYNIRFDWLSKSGLLDDQDELRKFREQNSAIMRMIDRTLSTVNSLGDRHASRYTIQRSAYDANLYILRKINIVDITQLSSLYAKTDAVRQQYFRIADSVAEYFNTIKSYCQHSIPDRTALGAALASERLTIRLLKDQKEELKSLRIQIQEQARRISISL
jgi:hypothetical protein